MKLYVSGKYAHWGSIGRCINVCKEIGYETTWDWTLPDARSLSMADAAERDAKGCADCDVHLVILDDANHPYRGTWFEVGISLAAIYSGSKKTIIVCNLTNNGFSDFPFYHHASLIKTFSWKETKKLLKTMLVVRT